jgi:hypothetical protein
MIVAVFFIAKVVNSSCSSSNAQPIKAPGRCYTTHHIARKAVQKHKYWQTGFLVEDAELSEEDK